MPLRPWTHALAAIALASPALAEEGGQIVLTIDGQDVVFPLWAEQSDWSGNASWASANIYTRAQGEDWERYKTLTLGFEGPSGAAGNPEVSLSRAVAGGGTESLYSTDEEGDLTVTVEGARVEGAFLSFSGTLSGVLGTSDNWGRDIDLTDPLPFEGRFEVTLGPVE